MRKTKPPSSLRGVVRVASQSLIARGSRGYPPVRAGGPCLTICRMPGRSQSVRRGFSSRVPGGVEGAQRGRRGLAQGPRRPLGGARSDE